MLHFDIRSRFRTPRNISENCLAHLVDLETDSLMRYNTAVKHLETAKKTSRQVDKFGEKVGIKLVLVLERSVIFFGAC